MQLNTPTHVTVVDNAKPLTETVSKELLSRNSDFGVFVERMKSIGRAFVVKDKKTNELSLVSLSEDESNFDTWADCCLRDYLERKRIFENRFKTRRNLIMRIVAITICFAVMLASFWPLWEVLIDVEADVYYKTLGLHSSSSPSEIKRAYREQVKIWHPDKNPSCGETCRLQMIKIQEAHNVLLSRGDHSFELANKYRNELLQLRSLVFFRVYQISLCAAQELLEIILRLFSGTTTNHNFVLGVACKAATMAFFTLYEGLYVSSFNFGMLISILYFGVTVTKSSVEEVKVQSVKKKSYMDLGQEALVLLVPLVLGSLGYACHWSASPWEDLFRCAFGCCYVMAFLYRFSPNIHDNFVMRKCSLPLEFVNFTTLNFSWLNFFFAEFGFVFDDLFVFTCRIPPIFRIVVYMIHCVFLCQFFMLPWDAPITGRNAQRIKQSEESISSKRSTVDQTSTQPTADALSEMTRVSDQARSQGDLARDAQQQRPQAVNRSLLSEEIQLIQGLDDETTTWLNIPMLKYSHLVAALQNSNKSDNNVSKIEILSSSDLQRVIFVRQNYDTAGGLKKKPNSPQFSVLLEIVDPDMSRLLALERGPTSVFPAKGVASAEDCNAAYRLLFTVNSNATSSLLWHQKAVSGINKGFGVFLIGSRQFAAVVVVLFALLLLLLVSALDVRGTCRSTTRELSPIVMNLGSLAVCCPDA